VCLLGWQMDLLPARGLGEYDFMCGYESYKFKYATESYRIFSANLRVDTPWNRLVIGGLRFLHSWKRKLKPIFRRLGLLDVPTSLSEDS
jgi:CelD/BcsL family acetyltransferase involved in cellulose biosynthesis